MSIIFCIRWSRRWRKIMSRLSDEKKVLRALHHIQYFDEQYRLAYEYIQRHKIGSYYDGNATSLDA